MKDKIKELADSVGAVYPVMFMGRHDGVLFTEAELETFANLVSAAEREACAKLCEERGMVKGGEVFSARIRSRGTT
jgi:6-phosphofructokinase